jgi:hypothetical protein
MAAGNSLKVPAAFLSAALPSALLSTITVGFATADDGTLTQTGDLVVSDGEARTIDGETFVLEFPVTVLDEDNLPLANLPLFLLGPDNTKVWSGRTDENGRDSFSLTFGKDNYAEEFTLRATVDNENLSKKVGFLTSTPIYLSKVYPEAEEGIPVTETPPPSPTIVVIVTAIITTVVAIGVVAWHKR